MEQADLGKRALAGGRYDAATQHYTAALKSVPTSPDYLIQRATAYQRTQNYQLALNDAESAVIHAQKRAKRELIVEAQFRRGCALHSLERYGDAQFVFALVKKMEDKHKMVGTWIGRNDNSLKRLAAGDVRAQCVVSETPEVDANGEVKTLPAANGSSSVPAAPVAAPQQTPAEKIRHEWYQNSTHVYFTLFAKGVPNDKLQIDIQERSLSISFPLVTGASYDLTLDPLFAPVNVKKCEHKVWATKIEVILQKAVPDQKWSKMETSEPVTPPPQADDTKKTNDTVKQAILNDATNTGPAYPTSSKSGPKNWDKVADGALRADSTGKGGIEDDDDYEGGDEANHFFKKLYKGASPDVQKAMMKSYTESNGTALSTNWDEVSKGKVETVPPNGMEAKSYEQ
ncbi:Cochaperone protein [Extremus antarcticus]|uniref:Cochaperone protein n=1 Tax=Extremus antarcticus TaxID=702011 RepID=A0AAJ0DCW5_9PEZI|nr:Cochaperone protein [Extremus antarcticus]